MLETILWFLLSAVGIVSLRIWFWPNRKHYAITWAVSIQDIGEVHGLKRLARIGRKARYKLLGKI